MAKLTDIKGIGPATIKVLQERKIKTVEALASLSLEELRKITGFKGELRARAVRQAALDSLRDKPAKPASAVDSSPRAEIKKIVTVQTVSAPETDKEKDKDKDKKKARKDDKKAVKDKEKKKKNKDKKKARKDDKKAVKDKEKKKKNKDKKKDGKKKDKKKS